MRVASILSWIVGAFRASRSRWKSGMQKADVMKARRKQEKK
jgi:hypothetical protein